MRELVERNAIIESTKLGDDDRGPSFWLYLDYGGSGQGFGGYALGGKFTHYVLMGVLSIAGVDKWEDLKGKPVRVRATNVKVHEIGHYLEDKWFNPDDYSDDDSK